MSGLVVKSMIGVAAATRSLLLVAILGVAAGAASASDNCDSYAKLTLQQAKQNVDQRCNFTGARWSLDAEQHRQWCKEVGPAGWRAELQLRNTMLAGCKR